MNIFAFNPFTIAAFVGIGLLAGFMLKPVQEQIDEREEEQQLEAEAEVEDEVEAESEAEAESAAPPPSPPGEESDKGKKGEGEEVVIDVNLTNSSSSIMTSKIITSLTIMPGLLVNNSNTSALAPLFNSSSNVTAASISYSPTRLPGNIPLVAISRAPPPPTNEEDTNFSTPEAIRNSKFLTTSVDLLQNFTTSQNNSISSRISRDGARFAISSNNTIQIHDFINNSFQITATIISPSEDSLQISFGTMISLYENYLAVSSTFSNSSSIVQIYQNSNKTWTQIGNTIQNIPILLYNSTRTSLSLCLSYEKSKLYIVIGNPNSNAFGFQSGQVKLFTFSNGIWEDFSSRGLDSISTHGTGRFVKLIEYRQDLILGISSFENIIQVYIHDDLYETWKVVSDEEEKALIGNSIEFVQNDDSLYLGLNHNEQVSIYQLVSSSSNSTLQSNLTIIQEYNWDRITTIESSESDTTFMTFNSNCIVITSKKDTSMTIQCADKLNSLPIQDEFSTMIEQEFQFISISDMLNNNNQYTLIAQKDQTIFIYHIALNESLYNDAYIESEF